MSADLDCLIIGGGPAGLMASVYLARSMRRVMVVDAGSSRASLIPVSHNYPGAADGIPGETILQNLRTQADEYSVIRQAGRVVRLEPGFTATLDDGMTISAPRVILATGIVDIKPNLPRLPEFLYKGAVRFCPICDAYATIDQRIGIVGPAKTAVRKALFMRTYSRDITLLPLEKDFRLTTEECALLNDADIAAPKSTLADLAPSGDKIEAHLHDGTVLTFDTIYPAMGAYVRSELAQHIDVAHTDSGCVITSDHHETNVPGLYAIGDLSTELHQISVAFGHAAIAATHVHNSLPGNFR